MKLHSLLCAVTLVVGMAVPAGATPSSAPLATDAPRAFLEARHAHLRTLVEGTRDEGALRAALVEAMDGFVDYESFARHAGTSFWDTLAPVQQKEYVALFTELVRATYVKRFHAGRPFAVSYRGATELDETGTKALVRTSLSSGDVGADIDYKLHRPAGRDGLWVYDVVVDEVSLARNYRSSFARTYREGGYALLASKLTARVEKERAARSDEPSSSELD